MQITQKFSRILAGMWVLSLIPWFIFILPGAGMAFDGGYTSEAYVFSGAVLSYPPMVILALISKRWFPACVFLPLLSVVCFLDPLCFTEPLTNFQVSRDVCRRLEAFDG